MTKAGIFFVRRVKTIYIYIYFFFFFWGGGVETSGKQDTISILLLFEIPYK